MVASSSRPTIAVITLHRVKNYGSVLQAFATQLVIERLGAKALVIDYWRPDLLDSEDAYFARSRWSKYQILRPAWKLFKGPWVRRNQGVFNSFVQQNLTLTEETYRSARELVDDPPVADTYCAGSDQVWNGTYNVGGSDPFFLSFAPEGARRISLSSSFGHGVPTPDVASLMAAHLPKFSLVTVRESSGEALLAHRGFAATQTLDPTLLIASEEWQRFCGEVPTSRRGVLVYQLGSDPNFSAVLDQVASSVGTEITSIDLRGRRPARGTRLRQPDVVAWVAAIRDCSYLVTDSFHGVAFALQFSKPFTVVLPENYSERIESLLALTGLEGRVAREGVVHSDALIDWTQVHDRLAVSRTESLETLAPWIRGR